MATLTPSQRAVAEAASAWRRARALDAGSVQGYEYDSTVAGSYAELVTTILAQYPSVYFDLSGMQTEKKIPGDPIDDIHHLYRVDLLTGALALTELGAFLGGQMASWPGRFLFGTDGTPGSSELLYQNQWVSTIPNYEEFLVLAGLESIRELFCRDNAYEVLYGEPRVVGTRRATPVRLPTPRRIRAATRTRRRRIPRWPGTRS